MDEPFWHQKWEMNQIGFHEPQVNPHLAQHLGSLDLPTASRVFIPLCGKTLDIAWLLAKGYRVVAIEWVERAIQQLFDELNVAPEIREIGKLKHYSAANLDIYVGDLFDLSKAQLGKVDAVYDRAALVAMPEDRRASYAAHVAEISNYTPQLLISYEYDQSLMPGPPFSVSDDELKRYFDDDYELMQLACNAVVGGLKDHPANESVWHLKRRSDK